MAYLIQSFFVGDQCDESASFRKNIYQATWFHTIRLEDQYQYRRARRIFKPVQVQRSGERNFPQAEALLFASYLNFVLWFISFLWVRRSHTIWSFFIHTGPINNTIAKKRSINAIQTNTNNRPECELCLISLFCALENKQKKKKKCAGTTRRNLWKE